MDVQQAINLHVHRRFEDEQIDVATLVLEAGVSHAPSALEVSSPWAHTGLPISPGGSAERMRSRHSVCVAKTSVRRDMPAGTRPQASCAPSRPYPPTGGSATLFRPGANRVFRGVLITLVLLAVATPLALMAWVRTPAQTGVSRSVEQPIPFDHRHHVRDDGIDCRYCHWTAERSPSAGLPASSLCMNCHAQVLVDSPLLEPVRTSVAERRPIPWMRVHRLPDFVYFDHSAHVDHGVGCETCHGRVDLMPQVRQVKPLSMGWCLECHRNPSPLLRPLDQVTTMGYRASAPDSARSPYLRAAPTNCTTCHR